MAEVYRSDGSGIVSTGPYRRRDEPSGGDESPPTYKSNNGNQMVYGSDGPVWVEKNQNPVTGDKYIPKYPDEYDDEPPEKLTCKSALRQNLLLILLACSMVIGVGMGMGLRPYNLNDRQIMYLSFPGKLLMRMLKIAILPLITSSLIAGIAALPSKAAGRMGAATVLYYMITTFIAVIIGIILVMSIQPGKRGFPSTHNARRTEISPIDSLLDLIRNIFPSNIVEACFTSEATQLPSSPPKVATTAPFNGTIAPALMTTASNLFTSTVAPTKDPSGIVYKVAKENRMNVLGVVVFCIAFGIVLGRLGKSGETVVSFFQGVHDAMVSLVTLIIWYSPVGIIFLLAGRIVSMDNPEQEFKALAFYAATVLAGLGIHGFIILPIIYIAFTRKNPFKHMFHMLQALLTALATASSSATLPVTMHCLETKAKVNRYVSRFVLPVGATINMDGTALYEAVAVIFIGQVHDYELNAANVIIIAFTATLAAIGAAGVPEAGLVTMLIVLSAVNFPLEGVEMIYAIDWMLDRCRTTINVWGDSVGAGVVEKLSASAIKKQEQADTEGRPHQVEMDTHM